MQVIEHELIIKLGHKYFSNSASICQWGQIRFNAALIESRESPLDNQKLPSIRISNGVSTSAKKVIKIK